MARVTGVYLKAANAEKLGDRNMASIIRGMSL